MKPKNRTPRRRAREFAVQALYQAALNQLPDAEVAKNIRENEYFAKADNELFTAIFFGVQAKRRELMQIIRPLLDRDEKDLSPIECAVLLAAAFELRDMPETPYPVIINEAIEVTKTFGGIGAYAAGVSYMPDGWVEPDFYQPSDRGLEQQIGQKLRQLKDLDEQSH